MLRFTSALLFTTVVMLFFLGAFTTTLTIAESEQAAPAGSSSTPSRLALQHSLDGGKTWIERGRIDPHTLDFEPSAATGKWTKSQLDQLRALALKKGTTASVAGSSVFVRVVDVDVDSSSDVSNVHSSIAISPCSLIVPRQYTSQLTYIAERYGVTVGKSSNNNNLRINSLRLMNPFHDEVCEPTIFKTKDENTEVKLKISFVKSPQLKNVGFPYGSSSAIEDTGANLHDGAMGRRSASASASSNSKSSSDNKDEQQPPVEEKSFWEKYGTYIMIFFAVQTLSGLFGPKGGDEKGGAGGKGKAKSE